MRTHRFPAFGIGVCLLLAGCGGEPPTPPTERYFADAKKNLDALDYDAALKNLDRLVKAAGDQPIGQQGFVVRTALLVALADGTKQMGDAYSTGMKQPYAQARQTQFVKMRADYYGIARVRLMNAMEAVMGQRAKLGEKSLPLDVRFPEYSGTAHPAVEKIKNGQVVEESDRYRAELESVRNALALVFAHITGAGDDVAKAHALFEKGALQIDPRVYLVQLSSDFLRLADIFGRQALDDPRYQRISLEVIRDNLDRALKLLEAKPDKDLEAQARKLKANCEKTLKTLGG